MNHIEQESMQPNVIWWEKIPQELRDRQQWVVWQKEKRDGKFTKVPYSPPAPHYHAKVDTPMTWGSFKEAQIAYATGKFTGVGFVFTESDPYVGIDLDKCREPETGKLDSWTQKIVESLQSYTEVSPSQTGVHILVRATLPPGARRKGTLEMYDSARFFCMTGQHLEGSPLTIEPRQGEVESLHAQTFPSKKESDKKVPEQTDGKGTGLTDEEVIQKSQKAKNGDKIEKLWKGEWQGSYPSQSEADLALCGQLAFWTGHNAEQLDRLFRQSRLFRPKWDERHSSDGSTYGQKLIEKVLANVQQTYQPQGIGHQGGGSPGKTDPPDLADGFLNSRGFQTPEGLRLRWYREQWWKFDGRIFNPTPMHDFRAKVMAYLQNSSARAKATKTLLNNVIANLEALCLMPHDVEWPAQWVEGKWISRPDMLVFENGMLSIEEVLKGQKVPKVLPHTPNVVSTVALPFAFDPEARWPKWGAFLEQVLPDPDCRQLIRELFGYCLTSDTSLQKFFLFEGVGANGKGVLLNILEKMLGKANVSSLPLESFGGAHGLEITLGKLVNITAEIGDMDRVAEGLLKQFTGGDSMHFNPKYRQSFSAKPTAKLIMATNVRPPFRDRSEGLWRRLIMVPFPVIIPEKQRNKELTQELTQELPGILNWAIGGAHDLRKRGRFEEPTVCVEARTEFKREANPAREYLVVNWYEDLEGQVDIRTIYEDYKKFCEINAYHPINLRNFGGEVRACFPNVARVRLSAQEDQTRPYAYKGIKCGIGAWFPESLQS